MSFENRYKEEVETIELSDDARSRIAATIVQAQQQEHTDTPLLDASFASRRTLFFPQRWIPALAVAASLLAVVGGMGITVRVLDRHPANAESAAHTNRADADTTRVDTDAQTASAGNASSYEDIYAAVIEAAGNRWEEHNPGFGDTLLDTALRGISPARAPQVDAEIAESTASREAMDEANTITHDAMTGADVSADGASAKEYSTTNVQVEGIDEADIVKTDGDYLYLIADNRLIIARAAGAYTTIVSETPLIKASAIDNRYPIDMFLTDDQLTILFSDYDFVVPLYEPKGLLDGLLDLIPGNRRYDSFWNPTQSRTLSVLYDIADRTQPTLVAQNGQDGDYVTSRLHEGIIYVVTTHNLYQRPYLARPASFVPCLFADDIRTPFSPDRIVIPEHPESASFVVITSREANTGELIDSHSLLGYTSTVYMSKDSLLIAQSMYDTQIIDSYIEDTHLVEHTREGYFTQLVRFSIDGGKLRAHAETQVRGELLNQFSLDEYKDTIRVVTTVSDREYKTYTDRKQGFSSYESIQDGPGSNALFIIDRTGEIIGQLTDLAPDELVYSVRFDGDVGYFVTFRQVDPLFTVDLSNPTKPKVLSELKIPGFSQYLHVYGKGLLFGLGMDADEQTGQTGGMKLSMFDTSDPTDVTEKHTLLLDSYYSEALYNHKAILVLPEKNLIAFPADNGYAVYGYDKKDGFYKRGEMSLANAYQGRGVMIDELLYVCTSDTIAVFELERFSLLTSVKF